MALGMWLRNRNCMKPTAETMMPKVSLANYLGSSAILVQTFTCLTLWRKRPGSKEVRELAEARIRLVRTFGV